MIPHLRSTDDLQRYQSALKQIANLIHRVSGPTETKIQYISLLVDAVLQGADVRDLETVEAIAAGTWKP